VFFELSASGNPRFSKIHPLLAGLLQAAALDPWERAPEGSVRLLPPPGEDEELCRDWEDFVQPDLRLHFDTERAVVAADLLKMQKEKGKNILWSLEIPRAHADAWLTTLNAQRLSLVAEYGLTEQELAPQETPDLSTERGISLMQVNFFAFIQECLVQVALSTMSEDEGSVSE
jgi:hypothetical protein